MRGRVVRIGNSQGLRIPKAILEACGIHDSVDLSVEEGRLVIRPLRSVREGWADAAQLMAERGDDVLVDPGVPTTFDEEEWDW